MKRLLRIVLAAVGVLLFAGGVWAAEGDIEFVRPAYRFDDVYGPSALGAQWLALVSQVIDEDAAVDDEAWGTGSIGGAARTGMSTWADFVIDRNHVYLRNRNYYTGISNSIAVDPAIETIFMVVPSDSARMWIEFTPPQSTPEGGQYTQDVLIDHSAYRVVKTPLSEATYPWKEWFLDFTKTSGASTYETRRGNLIFHQNPADTHTPSQTLQIPLIVANVYNGTAAGKPLLFRGTMREGNSQSGNIVAYDRFEWDVVNDKTVGGTDTDWVFVPVTTFPIDSNNVLYHLSTEITNYSGVRYAMQRYDALGINPTPLSPSYWRMDLPADVTDVEPVIAGGSVIGDDEQLTGGGLDELSHIPPGLITVYDRTFNGVTGTQNMFDMYQVDPAEGHRKLSLAHPSIFGRSLGGGQAEGGDATNYNDNEITGFKLLTASLNFLQNVASAMGVRGAAMPEPTGAEGVSADLILGEGLTVVNTPFITTDAINTVNVKATAPAALLASGDMPGLLPLHVTLNVPRSNRFVSARWNELYTKWRTSGRSVKDTFAQYFSVYTYDANGAIVDLFKWLRDNGAFDGTVKVFVDEDRQLGSQKGCITISFIVMLMDSPNKTTKMVADRTNTTDNSYLVMNDGKQDGTWNMTFFTAPVNYTSNPSNPSNPSDGIGGNSGSVGGSGGGSGCGVGASTFALFLACGLALCRKARG